ncbi:26S proteasome non-ATPase regulatory subunit 5, variant 2 [Balamuthia mandrillaris]
MEQQHKRGREESGEQLAEEARQTHSVQHRRRERELPLPELLMLLNTNDEGALMDVCSKIRERFAGEAGLQQLMSETVLPFLTEGLKHPAARVRELTLTQLERLAEHPQQGQPLLVSAGFVPLLIAALKDQSLGVVEAATKALLSLQQHQPQGQELVFSDPNLSLFSDMLQESDILRFRVLDLVGRSSILSPQTFQRVQHFFSPVLEELRGVEEDTDMLEKLNILPLLEKIMESETGLRYLDAAGAFQILHSLLTNESPYASVLTPSILNLIAKIAQKVHFFCFVHSLLLAYDFLLAGDETLKGDASYDLVFKVPFWEPIHQHLSGEDETCAEAATVAVGLIARTRAGMSALMGAQSATWRELVSHFRSLRKPLCYSSLYAFGEAMNCPDEELTEQAFDLAESESGDSLMRQFMKFLEQPFPDLRNAVFAALQGACTNLWALSTKLFLRPGFFEFITNRSTETTKEGKEWKYAILQTLYKLSTAQNKAGRPPSKELLREAVGSEKYEVVERYLRNGVFYVRGEHQLEMETRGA